jgi:hypothetical protein
LIYKKNGRLIWETDKKKPLTFKRLKALIINVRVAVAAVSDALAVRSRHPIWLTSL